MMAERLAEEAMAIPMLAFELAVRLGHDYLGGEHFLLALASSNQPAGAVLREHGVTPERVEAEIIRLSGARLFEDLDRDALAVIGIDVDAVRASVETRFGLAAVSQAAQAAGRGRGGFSRVLDNVRPRSGAQRDGVFLPHGPGAVQSLESACQEARAGSAPKAGVEHLALGILAVSEGLVPVVLSALGASVPALRTAIQDRYRQAS
jgi:ATP-dependent Clp protease ATP-binding subunit ClpA